MIDICFVGNSSIDYIQNNNGYESVFGGSCIYSALSCRVITNRNIAIISNVNKELFELLKLKNIKVIGNVLENLTSFEINEENNSCTFINRVDKQIEFEEPININNLHISFRKGVDIDYILNNPKINYNWLSVDVMIHSVESFIPYLQKYKHKIKTLFCNAEEYFIIEKLIQEIPNIIITNEEKPVILIKEGKNYTYSINGCNNIISTTGAGDSFIGGYFAKIIEDKHFDECINQGIYNSFESIKEYGPLMKIRTKHQVDISYKKFLII